MVIAHEEVKHHTHTLSLAKQSMPEVTMKRIFALLLLAVSLALQTAPVAAPTWSPTGSMNVARYQHTETVLGNGQILIAGGGTAAAELYDPTTGVFTATGSMSTARSGHTATLLVDGTVLITGGKDNSGNVLATAEIYNPTTGTFSPTTGPMNSPRSYHTATMLASWYDGAVLIAGGWNGTSTLATAEIYWPSSGMFTYTVMDMPDARQQHTATLLNNGTVLVAGGTQYVAGGYIYLNTAAYYDQDGESFAAGGTMSQARCDHTATLLQDGTVLMSAGFGPLTGGGFGALASAEIYTSSGLSTLTTGSLSVARYSHTAALLNNGSVLVAGGETCASCSGGETASAEVYNPASGTFSSTVSMIAARWLHAAALLPSGNVLVTGGIGTSGSALASAEIYLDVPPQPINTTQDQPSVLTYNYGPYNFVVDYYGDKAYQGLSLAATPMFMTPAQFSQNRLAGTSYSGATCSLVNGTGGNCVVFELTCQNTTTGAEVTCPTPTNTSTTYTFTINWDTTDNTSDWSMSNTALLEAPVGTNTWDNIQTFFSPTRTDEGDPTTSGRTPPGYSDFVFVYNVTTGTPPAIMITTPQSGAVYLVSENVLAEYSCTGSVVSCVGNVPSGQPIDTSCAVSSCSKTFTVNAIVNSGPTALPQTVNYQVSSTVNADTTSISAPTIIYGAAASVTVSVTSVAGTVPGNVSLTVDSGSPLTQALSGGSTVFTISGLGGGSHSLSASYAAQGAFATSSATGTLQVNPASQTITVTTAAPGTASYGTTFTVAATASSGLPVAITTSGACSGSGSGSASITMTSGTGTCTVYFDQAGNANYSAAPEVTNSTAATPGPVASVSPSSINFGTVYLGTITVKGVTVTNVGGAPLTISTPFFSILSGGDPSEFVEVNLCPKSLAVAKSCTIEVSLVAYLTGTQTAMLNVMDNAPGGSQTVTLRATVINPKASLSAYSLPFGKQKVGTTSGAQTVTLTNTGTTPLLLGTLTISGDFAFASGTTCTNGSSLAPNTPCTINITFTPTAPGSRSGKVVITDNALLSPQIVSLLGTGN